MFIAGHRSAVAIQWEYLRARKWRGCALAVLVVGSWKTSTKSQAVLDPLPYHLVLEKSVVEANLLERQKLADRVLSILHSRFLRGCHKRSCGLGSIEQVSLPLI